MTTYYKALKRGRRGTHTEYVWPEPGVWVEIEGGLVPCHNGLHVCRADQLLDWLSDELWVVEVDGEVLDAGDKAVVRRARLVAQVPGADRLLRLFVADCAERALPLFEERHPGDSRPRQAIAAARAFARGEINADSLAAARDAAGDAARAAAWAAGDAAWTAAWTARGAARDAAWAAGDAAWTAAAVASGAAAGDAAGDAAAVASGAAAGDAAWAAEREWQTARLAEYLEGRA